jgi:hypothetical protein
VSVVRGMTQAEWEAAVRLAAGKRVLTQCLFHFRYGGDRPAALDLLPDDGGDRQPAGDAPNGQPEAAGSGDCDDDVAPGVVSEMFDLLRSAGVAVKQEEGEEEPAQAQAGSSGQQQQQQQQPQQADASREDAAAASQAGSDAEGEEDEDLALRTALCGDGGSSGGGGQGPDATEDAAAEEAEKAGPSGAARPGADRPALQVPQPPQLTAAEAARRAALLAEAQAALSLVREVPGAPPASASLTGEADLARQRRRLQRREAPGASGGAGVMLPLGGGVAGARLHPEVAAAIEAAMPPRSIVFERHGAAGTSTDQRRESPIVEVQLRGRRCWTPAAHAPAIACPAAHPHLQPPALPVLPLPRPHQVSLLLAEAVQHGLRTIAFCKTRKLSEMVSKYTRDTLRLSAPALAERLSVYRGGYTPGERRGIEAALHSGALAGVAATNALELGVDIGGLDVTLHLVGLGGGRCRVDQNSFWAGALKTRRSCKVKGSPRPAASLPRSSPPARASRALSRRYGSRPAARGGASRRASRSWWPSTAPWTSTLCATPTTCWGGPSRRCRCEGAGGG